MEEHNNIFAVLGSPETMLDADVKSKTGERLDAQHNQNSISQNNILPGLMSMLSQKETNNNLMNALIGNLGGINAQSGANLINNLLNNKVKASRNDTIKSQKSIEKFKKIKHLN